MGTIVNFENEPRPSWLPKGASLVKAAGEPCDVSLADEYSSASPERQERFAQELRALAEKERQSMSEDLGLRF